MKLELADKSNELQELVVIWSEGSVLTTRRMDHIFLPSKMLKSSKTISEDCYRTQVMRSLKKKNGRNASKDTKQLFCSMTIQRLSKHIWNGKSYFTCVFSRRCFLWLSFHIWWRRRKLDRFVARFKRSPVLLTRDSIAVGKLGENNDKLWPILWKINAFLI